MTIQHVDIADPQIHEPKGAGAAAVNTVYIADGAGSGSWAQIDEAQLAAAVEAGIISQVAANILDGTTPLLDAQSFLFCIIPDVSTASTLFVPVPENATLIEATMTLEGAITVADATVEFKTAADVSMGTQVIAFTGSAAGDTDTFVPTGNNVLTGPTFIKVSTDGGSTDAQRLFITLHFYIDRVIP